MEEDSSIDFTQSQERSYGNIIAVFCLITLVYSFGMASARGEFNIVYLGYFVMSIFILELI